MALFRAQQIDGILLEISASYTASLDVLSCLKGQMGDRCPPIVVIDGSDAEMAVEGGVNLLKASTESFSWRDARPSHI
ncbi:hypothetical protein H6F88_00075 [Oculatella sp. FACHB-28]|uniref:hypothetical protein n=1 Tax=Oculatella sp. FACHB-28 TaxID=2692845 RepID=UPI001687F24A|nr:hypothetical protein [Oculatella sp. FACHB-28]MBD2054450.1 hypothetical protein [Oculatella sp. FACHB-28]